jgi:hypothetical protein
LFEILPKVNNRPIGENLVTLYNRKSFFIRTMLHLDEKGEGDEAQDDGDDGVGEAGSGKAQVEVAAKSQSGVLGGVAVGGCKKKMDFLDEMLRFVYRASLLKGAL